MPRAWIRRCSGSAVTEPREAPAYRQTLSTVLQEPTCGGWGPGGLVPAGGAAPEHNKCIGRTVAIVLNERSGFRADGDTVASVLADLKNRGLCVGSNVW